MALNQQEQDLLDAARASLPAWASNDAIPNESLSGYAKIIGMCRAWMFRLIGEMGYIGHATGPSGGGPDWLGEHAKDRGTYRQGGESDPLLRERLWNTTDMVSEPAIQASVDALLAAAGIVGSAVVYELRKSMATLASNTADQGTGGTFALYPTITDGVTFAPTAGFANGRPPLAQELRREQTHRLVISGAASIDNDGVFPVVGISGDGVILINNSGVAELDPTASWRIDRYTESDALLTGGAGNPDSYISRGYRIGSMQPTIVCMLPTGSSAALAESIKQHILSICGAGVNVVVEHNP